MENGLDVGCLVISKTKCKLPVNGKIARLSLPGKSYIRIARRNFQADLERAFLAELSALSNATSMHRLLPTGMIHPDLKSVLTLVSHLKAVQMLVMR
jgi:hypothetical protein